MYAVARIHIFVVPHIWARPWRSAVASASLRFTSAVGVEGCKVDGEDRKSGTKSVFIL